MAVPVVVEPETTPTRRLVILDPFGQRDISVFPTEVKPTPTNFTPVTPTVPHLYLPLMYSPYELSEYKWIVILDNQDPTPGYEWRTLEVLAGEFAILFLMNNNKVLYISNEIVGIDDGQLIRPEGEVWKTLGSFSPATNSFRFAYGESLRFRVLPQESGIWEWEVEVPIATPQPP